MTLFGVDIVALVVTLVVGFILGLLFDWLRSIPNRRRASRLTRDLRELIGLLREGTRLRNHGWNGRAENDHANWHSEWKDWEGRAEAKAVEVDEIRAERVSLLGTPTQRPFSGVTQTQALNDLSEFTLTLERLDTFIQDSVQS